MRKKNNNDHTEYLAQKYWNIQRKKDEKFVPWRRKKDHQPWLLACLWVFTKKAIEKALGAKKIKNKKALKLKMKVSSFLSLKQLGFDCCKTHEEDWRKSDFLDGNKLFLVSEWINKMIRCFKRCTLFCSVVFFVFLRVTHFNLLLFGGK